MTRFVFFVIILTKKNGVTNRDFWRVDTFARMHISNRYDDNINIILEKKIQKKSNQSTKKLKSSKKNTAKRVYGSSNSSISTINRTSVDYLEKSSEKNECMLFSYIIIIMWTTTKKWNAEKQFRSYYYSILVRVSSIERMLMLVLVCYIKPVAKQECFLLNFFVLLLLFFFIIGQWSQWNQCLNKLKRNSINKYIQRSKRTSSCMLQNAH